MVNFESDLKVAMRTIANIAYDRALLSADSAAQEALKAIFEERFWSDDTYNLRDSFGYAIYYKGKERSRGFLEAQKATERYVPKGALKKVGSLSGREQANAFFDSYRPRSVDIEIVFVAGMYYAVYLQWKSLLMGFLFGEQEAKRIFIDTIRRQKIAR